MVVTRTDKPTHDQIIRAKHVNAINIIREQALKAQGTERNMLNKAEAYHLARLHSRWFSSSKKEKNG